MTTREYKYAVALTGGIATGKSTVSAIMSELGLPLVDADTIAHEMLDMQSHRITEMFGEGLVKDHRVDRKALGSIVFADETARMRLEGLLHPLIKQEIDAQASMLDKLHKPYLIDIPLFYERNAYPIDKVLVVYVPRQLQISRLMARNSLSEAEALQRIHAQMDIEQKRDKATYLLDNAADMEHLAKECQRIHAKIIADFAEK
jgi:dephospho-CoA kinase